eukprot:gene8714-9599_t
MADNPSDIKVKAEPGGTSSSKPLFKPKFVPKIPVKTENAPLPPPPEAAPAKSSQEGRGEKKGGRLHRNSDRGRGSGSGSGGDNRPGRGSSGAGGRGGRGQWTMPMGSAFFSGNATAQLLNKSRNIVIGPGSSSSAKSEAPAAPRVLRPNEDIGLLEEEMDAAQSAALMRSERETLEDSDSDASVEAVVPGNELWPPAVPISYPPAPVQLPLGPPTVALRKQLASQPLLANPEDEAALLAEEASTLLLLQLPAALALPNKSGSRPTPNSSSNHPSHSTQTETNISSGVLGKIQLLRSGKARLIARDGQIYEVAPGMVTAFQQTIAQIELPPETPAPIGLAGGVSTTATAGVGSLHLLGQVTRKVVVTPRMEDYMRSLTTQTKTVLKGGSGGGEEATSSLPEGEEVGQEEDMAEMAIDDF